MMKKGYTCFKLTNKGRAILLKNVHPLFKKIIAHHVTYEFGVTGENIPSINNVVAIAVSNNDKIQSVVVEINVLVLDQMVEFFILH